MENKYNMTKEENIFLAKRNLVDIIWKSANLEGISITSLETQLIIDGGNVSHLRLDEIVTINNLKHAWQFLISSIDDDINENYISSIHSLVGSNLVEEPGKMRIYNVSMAGTEWKPEIPSKEKLQKILNEYSNKENLTEGVLTLMCRLMKLQYFNDGNKRTSMLVANHELIKNGAGIISIADKNKIEFGNKLIEFYENEEKLEDLKNFLYDNCLDGIEV